MESGRARARIAGIHNFLVELFTRHLVNHDAAGGTVNAGFVVFVLFVATGDKKSCARLLFYSL